MNTPTRIDEETQIGTNLNQSGLDQSGLPEVEVEELEIAQSKLDEIMQTDNEKKEELEETSTQEDSMADLIRQLDELTFNIPDESENRSTQDNSFNKKEEEEEQSLPKLKILEQIKLLDNLERMIRERHEMIKKEGNTNDIDLQIDSHKEYLEQQGVDPKLINALEEEIHKYKAAKLLLNEAIEDITHIHQGDKIKQEGLLQIANHLGELLEQRYNALMEEGDTEEVSAKIEKHIDNIRALNQRKPDDIPQALIYCINDIIPLKPEQPNAPVAMKEKLTYESAMLLIKRTEQYEVDNAVLTALESTIGNLHPKSTSSKLAQYFPTLSAPFTSKGTRLNELETLYTQLKTTIDGTNTENPVTSQVALEKINGVEFGHWDPESSNTRVLCKTLAALTNQPPENFLGIAEEKKQARLNQQSNENQDKEKEQPSDQEKVATSPEEFFRSSQENLERQTLDQTITYK